MDGFYEALMFFLFGPPDVVQAGIGAIVAAIITTVGILGGAAITYSGMRKQAAEAARQRKAALAMKAEETKALESEASKAEQLAKAFKEIQFQGYDTGALVNQTGSAVPGYGAIPASGMDINVILPIVAIAIGASYLAKKGKR